MLQTKILASSQTAIQSTCA